MMNRKDFFEYVKDNLKEYLPEKYADANIHLQEVVKKNGLTLTAVVVRQINRSFSLQIKTDILMLNAA